jgi:phosphatidylserine/phosphatidylglycerophosphate/cardiolipin synthase-like enzyme
MKQKGKTLFGGATRNKVTHLLDGPAYFKSVAEAIRSASTGNDYIYILGWMLDINFELIAGDKSTTLSALLAKAAAGGARIRILVWNNLLDKDYRILQTVALIRLKALPNSQFFLDSDTFFPQRSRDMLRKMAAGGLAIARALGGTLMVTAPSAREPGRASIIDILTTLGKLANAPNLGAQHEKVVVVKAKGTLIAYCGGIDFNRNRVEAKVNIGGFEVPLPFPTYHDTACRIEGPAAYDILKRFERRWKNHSEAATESLPSENEHPPVEPPVESPDTSHYVQVVGTYNSPDGRISEHSLADAYFEIIKNAERYIYIEDQYVVHPQVAQALNLKLREPGFEMLFIATQDTAETEDIFIARRKREDFFGIVLSGVTEAQRKKLVVATLDRSRSDSDVYHPGMHAKTLIVDDEIAIIGSANLSLRSFNTDSETCVVVFDEPARHDSFARTFRMDTWRELLRRNVLFTIGSPTYYPSQIAQGRTDFSKLILYDTKLQHEDIDEIINQKIAKATFQLELAQVTGAVAIAGAILPSPQQVKDFFDLLWDYFIEAHN